MKARIQYFKTVYFFLIVVTITSALACKSGKTMIIESEKDLIKAIQSSKNSEIYLESMTYNLNSSIIVTKPVKLIGKSGTIIKTNVLDQNGISVISDNVSIENIHFIQNAKSLNVPEHQHFKRSDYDRRSFIKKGLNFNSGIRIYDAKNVTVKNCVFTDWVGDGVLVFGGSEVIIENNEFYSPYYIQYSADIHIKGVKGARASNISIIGNKCTSNNRHGISVGNGGFVSDVLVKSNQVICDFKKLGKKHLRNHGILVYYGADHVPENSGIKIHDNQISGTLSTGIYATGGYEVEIKGNVINHVGLANAGKISGGILVVNFMESVLIEGNSIYNYQGSFDERGAISLFGSTKGHNGKIVIRNNIIKNSSNGIALDQEVPEVLIENNETEDIEKFNLYLRRQIGVKVKKGKVTLLKNNFGSNLIDSIPSISIQGKNLIAVKISNNTIAGNKESTCFRVDSDDVEIESNEINDFGEVLEVKTKGRKVKRLKLENNNLNNVTRVIAKKSVGHSANLEKKNSVTKRLPKN